MTPEGIAAANPAFDVTPNKYVGAIITENGIAGAPFEESLRRVCSQGVAARG
jgi:methylthioribose-1-phosphate isomerase